MPFKVNLTLVFLEEIAALDVKRKCSSLNPSVVIRDSMIMLNLNSFLKLQILIFLRNLIAQKSLLSTILSVESLCSKLQLAELSKHGKLNLKSMDGHHSDQQKSSRKTSLLTKRQDMSPHPAVLILELTFLMTMVRDTALTFLASLDLKQNHHSAS